MLTCHFDRVSNAPGSHDMIILDQDAISQIVAMIFPTSNTHRVLFEKTPSWGCFPGIHDVNIMFPYRIDIAPSYSGNSTESLQEIECDPFPFKQLARSALKFCNDGPRLEKIAIFGRGLDTNSVIQCGINLAEDLHPC